MRKLLAFLAVAALSLSSLHAVDISITAASVIPSSSAQLGDYTAGATITAGQIVYFDTSTNTVKLADADASAAASLVRGIAVNGASAGQSIKIVTSDPELTIGGTRTVGDVYILSATAGGVAPMADLAQGMYTTVVGVVVSTTKICFGTTMKASAAKA